MFKTLLLMRDGFITMVHIKNIKMTGFKSFGTATKVVKLKPGFTCIVGPNGSGKSNCIDAISFCLGTLSKKSMRANRLTDLLYNGGKNGESAKKTIVEINFDNSDHKIPLKEKTVIISRELKRDGGGVYRLNGKRTTRADILDKLRIAGIDCVDGYNIIQQGQIAEIVGMSSIQRRELLEGVAGVGQFDEKKAIALAELDEAQKKMGELNLLINELSYRVDSLIREKESAEKWIDLGEKIKETKSELLSIRLAFLQKDIKKLNDEIDGYNKTINELEKEKHEAFEIRDLNDKIMGKQTRLQEVEMQQIEINETFNTLKIKIAKFEQQRDFTSKNFDQLKKEISKSEQQKENVIKSIQRNEEETKRINQNIYEFENEIKDRELLRRQIEDEISNADNEFEDLKIETDRINLLFQDINDQISKLDASADTMASEIDRITKNKKSKIQQIEEIERVMDSNRSKILNVQQIINDESKAKEELNDKTNQFAKHLENQLKIIESRKIQIKGQTDELLVLKTKIDMIESNVEQSKKINTATSYILENKEDLPGVVGTLKFVYGDEEEIPRQLHHLKHALVVKDLVTVVRCIQKLKEGVIGSCEFIPIQHLGIDLENIKSDLKIKIASSIAIVEDISEAVEVWKNYNSVQVRTSSGDIFNPNGIVVGGFNLSTSKDQIDPLIELQDMKTDEINRLLDDQERLELAKVRIVEASNSYEKIGRNQEKRIRESTIELQHLHENLKQEKELFDIYSVERGVLETEEVEKKIQLEKIQRELKEKEVVKKKIEEELNEAKNNLDNLKFSDLQKKLSKINKELLKIESNKIRNEERRKNLEENLSALEQRLEQISQRKSELKKEREKLVTELNEINEKIVLTSRDTTDRESDLKNVNDETNDCKKGITNLRRDIKKKERKNIKTNKKIKIIQDSINNSKITRAKLETEQEAIFFEAKEYQIEIKKVPDELLEEYDSEELKSLLQNLGNNRKNLEPVNMRSIEDYISQKKRLDHLLETKKVLTEERQIILNNIIQIETEKINTFLKSFNKIVIAFNEIFHQLAGGKAQLHLENEEEIFEGGVIIEAHPAGKKIKSLESMSGGEKSLTALAFIFAIQQSEPQPFYVLDEIDAALDVKNVDKVARLIAKMGDGTSRFGKAQFLVISHRDILMAKADTIYGTTNVDGLTQMMQIQLEKDGFYREVTKYKKATEKI